MVELLICNQRVGGSNPSVGSIYINYLCIINARPIFLNVDAAYTRG